ncbi:ABC transporter ATP-binding protein [Paenibacillus daejeonensis]|uniref:ABC transporter ATP-binding protein n=1 Tax=Paenibacillus daejeonensis TaxID=135193 RepID=UPI0003789A6F|nr:ABC transporter ATP-binding protein [Paenibacillus daejeonensis]
MLAIRNVSKYYGTFCALKDIDLELSHGVYGLLAPNGAGKTTLIKLLVTLLFPTKGEILYNGKNILGLDEHYREQLGYLPQQFGYYKNYSPNQYLMYIAALKGIGKAEAKTRIGELLRLVALEEVAHKKMKAFSGGMIQRVGIAQAMLNDPKILILDEPTAGLDPKERVRFRNLLSELARERIVILSTHIVSDVESIAGEIIMIKDSRILYQETVEQLCQTLEGRVYETLMDYEAADDFRRRVLSLSEKQEQGRLRIRFMADGETDESWQSVRPQLEDVFLHVYRDEEAVTPG